MNSLIFSGNSLPLDKSGRRFADSGWEWTRINANKISRKDAKQNSSVAEAMEDKSPHLPFSYVGQGREAGVKGERACLRRTFADKMA